MTHDARIIDIQYVTDPKTNQVYPVEFIRHDRIPYYDFDTTAPPSYSVDYSDTDRKFDLEFDLEYKFAPYAESQLRNESPLLYMTSGGKRRNSQGEYWVRRFESSWGADEIENSNPLTDAAMNYLLYIEE